MVIYLPAQSTEDTPILDELTPREIVRELDRQEDLLRKGYRPSGVGWPEPELVSSEATFHRGDSSIRVPTIPGDYSAYYRGVRESLQSGSAMPVTRDFVLSVARIIDDAKRWY